MITSQIYLEQYTLRRSQEVLMVTVETDGVQEEIMVYKGFSGSLSRATVSDPDLPVIPETALVVKIDRLKAPYNPQQPQYIAQGLSWQEFLNL